MPIQSSHAWGCSAEDKLDKIRYYGKRFVQLGQDLESVCREISESENKEDCHYRLDKLVDDLSCNQSGFEDSIPPFKECAEEYETAKQYEDDPDPTGLKFKGTL